jgi:hypothetical protein
MTLVQPRGAKPRGDDVALNKPNENQPLDDAGSDDEAVARRYLPPFSTMQVWLARRSPDEGESLVMSYEDLVDIFRHLLVAVPVDEGWYRQRHPDVAKAIDAGAFVCAAHHYAQHGYFEDRRPFEVESATCRFPPAFATIESRLEVTPARGELRVRIDSGLLREFMSSLLESIPVDEAWYRNAYPGVSQAVARGVFTDARQHFMRHGYFESRWPFKMYPDETWYLARYPDAKRDVDSGTYRSAREHFSRVGYRQGRLPTGFWFSALWDRARVSRG